MNYITVIREIIDYIQENWMEASMIFMLLLLGTFCFIIELLYTKNRDQVQHIKDLQNIINFDNGKQNR